RSPPRPSPRPARLERARSSTRARWRSGRRRVSPRRSLHSTRLAPRARKVSAQVDCAHEADGLALRIEDDEHLTALELAAHLGDLRLELDVVEAVLGALERDEVLDDAAQRGL